MLTLLESTSEQSGSQLKGMKARQVRIELLSQPICKIAIPLPVGPTVLKMAALHPGAQQGALLSEQE